MTIGAVAIASGPVAGPAGAAVTTTGGMPTVGVLFETADGVYVDIGDDFRRIETFRGRNRELDRFQAGTAQVVLSDRLRTYDPLHTGSPLYPHVKPMRGVRVEATWDGVTYPIFTGTVDSIEHQYAGPLEGDATATLYCTDGFKDLAAAGLQSSGYYQEVLADGPVGWWHLGESGDTLYDAAGTRHLTVNGAQYMTMGDTGLVSREEDGALTVADGDAAGAVGGSSFGGPVLTGVPFTLECVFRLTVAEHPGGGGQLFAQTGSTGVGFSVNYADTFSEFPINIQVVSADGNSDNLRTVYGAHDYADGLIHHFVFTLDATMFGRIYIDGVEVANEGAGPDDSTITGSGSFVGSDTFIVGGETGKWWPFQGTLDEVAVYDHVLTAARVAAHAATVTTPWNNDTPGERIGRVLDVAGWPDTARELDDGNATLQSVALGGTVLDHAALAAATDFGILFVTAAGTVRFIGRDGLFNLPQLATFGDGGGAELGYRQLTPEYTDQLIRNDVTVSRLEGVAQRVQDADSIGEYLRHSYTVDGLLHDDDVLSRNAAEFLVNEYKDPQRRISNLVVSPRGAPASLFPQVLARELAEQITVIDRPPGGGTPNEQDSAIEGIAHSVMPMGWETVWNVAPSFGSIADPPAIFTWDVTAWDEHRWGF